MPRRNKPPPLSCPKTNAHAYPYQRANIHGRTNKANLGMGKLNKHQRFSPAAILPCTCKNCALSRHLALNHCTLLPSYHAPVLIWALSGHPAFNQRRQTGLSHPTMHLC
eukprot:1148619-Pelagomonas_calceolata.AAC.4